MPKKTNFDTGSKALKPLKSLRQRKSLGQMVYENLRQAIVRGSIAPGTRLVENQIAEAQGISRTPVREAIHKLERERFLERLMHGGFKVLGLSRQDIVETFGIRSVLEGYAARLAALNYRADDLEALEAKIDEFQRLLEKKTAEAPARSEHAVPRSSIYAEPQPASDRDDIRPPGSHLPVPADYIKG